MFWCRGFALNNAITLLKASRACNPRIVAIRQVCAAPLFATPTQQVLLPWFPGSVPLAVCRSREHRPSDGKTQ